MISAKNIASKKHGSLLILIIDILLNANVATDDSEIDNYVFINDLNDFVTKYDSVYVSIPGKFIGM